MRYTRHRSRISVFSCDDRLRFTTRISLSRALSQTVVTYDRRPTAIARRNNAQKQTIGNTDFFTPGYGEKKRKKYRIRGFFFSPRGFRFSLSRRGRAFDRRNSRACVFRPSACNGGGTLASRSLFSRGQCGLNRATRTQHFIVRGYQSTRYCRFAVTGADGTRKKN